MSPGRSRQRSADLRLRHRGRDQGRQEEEEEGGGGGGRGSNPTRRRMGLDGGGRWASMNLSISKFLPIYQSISIEQYSYLSIFYSLLTFIY